MAQPLRITTFDIDGNVMKVETEHEDDGHPTITPGQKVKLDAKLGSVKMNELLKEKREELVAEANSDGEDN